ncbi:uncharacterized protein LOC135815897 [Sycon ciliatum]|uniref:uncharacterized protein LOC135815897 n=1 Tax=Sycon ciliatum TaxID=27933 RepID=UPI0020AAE2B9|eukprot:scpid106423/ scgid17844/ 28S ribosomal protein S18c, mitochondrial; 28S ribosomal protein S18-1, mitochondrial
MALIGQLPSKVALPLSPFGVRHGSIFRKRSIINTPIKKHPSDFFEGIRAPGINDCPNNCLCTNPDSYISWKNPSLLSQFTSTASGLILHRRTTGLCEWQQRRISKQIKRAQTLGLMPYLNKAPTYFCDPELFPPKLDEISEEHKP